MLIQPRRMDLDVSMDLLQMAVPENAAGPQLPSLKLLVKIQICFLVNVITNMFPDKYSYKYVSWQIQLQICFLVNVITNMFPGKYSYKYVS